MSKQFKSSKKEIIPLLEDIYSQKDYEREEPFIIDYSIGDAYSFEKKPTSKIVSFFRKISYFLSLFLEQEERRGTRFIIGVSLAILGSVFYYSLDSSVSSLFFLFTAASIFFFRLSVGFIYKAYLLWYFCTFFFLGFSLAKFEDWRYQSPMLSKEQTSHIEGRILEIEKKENGFFSVTISISSSQAPKIASSVKKIKVAVRQKIQIPKESNFVKGFVKLSPFSGPLYPGGYDFAFYNYFKGIGAQGYFLTKPIFEKREIPLTFFQNFFLKIDQLRDDIHERIKKILPGEEGSIASALITGKKQGISEKTKQAYRVSGLAHILSISGLHMAIITGITLIGLRYFLILIPFISSRYNVKKITAFLAIIIATFYLFIAGMGISVVRSYVMVSVMLFAILFDRAAISMRNLAISALLVLIFFPHEVLNPGFQMSYSTTAALIASFHIWKSYREKIKFFQDQIVFVGSRYLIKILTPIFTTIFISIVATIASSFFSVYHFSNIAPLGLVSNVLAFPFISFLIMPLALISVFAMLFHLEYFPLIFLEENLKIIKKIAYKITALTPDIPLTIFPIASLIFFSIALVIFCCFTTKIRFFFFPFLLLGIILCFFQQKPLFLISENGRYIGSFLEKYSLAINRSRISPFVKQNWERAFSIKKFIKPQKNSFEFSENFFSINHFLSQKYFLGKNYFLSLNMPEAFEYLPQNILKENGILVLNYATFKQELPLRWRKNNQFLIISKQDLARKGAVFIYKDKSTKWALGNKERNWNEYRFLNHHSQGF